MLHHFRTYTYYLQYVKNGHLKSVFEKTKVKHFCTAFFSALEIIMATNRYCIDVAKRGTAGCKECKKKIDKGDVRLAKIIPNPFTESGGEMKQWFHVRCMFVKLSRARASTKKIDSTDDIEGWDDVADEYKEEVLNCLSEFSFNAATKKTPAKKPKIDSNDGAQSQGTSTPSKSSSPSKDDTLREFRKICNKIGEEPSYLEKSAILKKFFTKGSDGESFKGDLYLWIKLLLPSVEKRIYNLQSKQLVKLFSEIFQVSQEEMLEDLEQGDVAQTIGTFFENSILSPAAKSTLTLQEVDGYLEELTKFTKEAEQTNILKKVAKRCTANDLRIFIRLIKHDLRITAGPKPVLDAIHPSAYEAFQASRNLKNIVMDVIKNKQKGGDRNILTVESSLMTPVLPMLAQACNSIEMAYKKCPEGFFVEIKYDGERVQIHKRGSEFSYFSRSLKPVMGHKVLHFKDYIPQAFPHGANLIIDSEILLVSKDGIPLPFGTLGAHKKTAFKDATVCLYVFDILQFNDEILMKKPLFERRELLKKNMIEIKNHIMFSEMKEINDPKELKGIINSVIKQGLEGLVIKNKMGTYEPGKRHWLKVKKDYLTEVDLKEGTMADSADLVVLGAYYGTGKYGGKKSIFLMGCLDEYSGKWCTVTKVRGFTDDELEELQDEPKMIKISKNQDLVPSWLRIKKALVPDFIVEDIEKSAVWEVIGTEFSKANAHTANGISIRFPRVKCIREKSWKQSTTLKALQNLYDLSKQTADRVGLEIIESDCENDGESDTAEASSTSSTALKRQSDEKLAMPKKIKTESSSKEAVIKSENEIKTESSKEVVIKSENEIKTESSSKEAVIKCENEVLPNVFSGVKLYVPSSVKDADVLKRHFIAYDGTLLKESEIGEANVIIESEEEIEAPKNAVKVSVDWLWACIKLKKKLPTKLYKPK